NMPGDQEVSGRIVRVNDGNDSNHQREFVIAQTAHYLRHFYNTSCPDDLEGYGAPVVLTVNPGEMTDKQFFGPPPAGVSNNLMFVRVRTNTWNLKEVVDLAIRKYTELDIPVVLTFMAYHEDDSIPSGYHRDYDWRERTLNSYWAITHDAWKRVMARYEDNPLVHSCGTEGVSTACRHCGNCLREYWATVERMRA
ncbi:hypothetical protein LCGC14_1548860, partial [marine sediment metagenome]